MMLFPIILIILLSGIFIWLLGISHVFDITIEDDSDILEGVNDLDIYIKQAIYELQSEGTFKRLSEVVDYAAKLNYRNNYDKDTIQNLTKEEYSNIISNLVDNYESILNKKLTYDKPVKEYLLKRFIDDIAF